MGLIAYCGLNCDKCEAYIATQAGDEDAKAKIAEKWRIDYNSPEITAANATCDGMRHGRWPSGRIWPPMSRPGGCAKSLLTCAHCDAYGSCQTLAGFLGFAPSLKDGLEVIRRSLGKA